MSVIIKYKSKKIFVVGLNQDSNYELNQINILSSISHVKWSPYELYILNNHDLIDWDIYSARDLTYIEVEKFRDFISVHHYLCFLENKYNILPDKAFDCLLLFNNIDLVLSSHINNAPYFYFNNFNFIKAFKYLFNLHDHKTVKRCIVNLDIFTEFIDILPISEFAQVINRLIDENIFTEQICNRIYNRLQEYPHERSVVFKILFSKQVFSISFINSRNWTSDIWESIFQKQIFTDNQLLQLLPHNRYNISKYYKLPMNFIEQYHKQLDWNAVLLFQALTYEFVKKNKNLIDFELLMNNKKINFKIVRMQKLYELQEYSYIILKSVPNENVVFID